MSLSGDPGAQRAATVGEEPAVFRLRNVTKHFGGVTAVEEVGFGLRPGEVHALVGENGAGKSTLMKMVHGLYRPDEGMLEVGGEVVEFSSPRDAETAGIAMIPQELDLFPELSVTENLFVGRPRPRTGWGGLDRNAMRAEARRRLSSLGVDLDVTTTVKRLSAAGGGLCDLRPHHRAAGRAPHNHRAHLRARRRGAGPAHGGPAAPRAVHP